MLPGVYGFKWAAGNLVFLAIFYTVVTVVICTVTIAISRAIRASGRGEREAIQWEADFEDLPKAARTCRHEFTGEFMHRVCPNGFDCRECAPHARLAAAMATPADDPARGDAVCGFSMPADRMYHRGHTWIRQEKDGCATVGLDDFAARVIGSPEEVELPAVGDQVRVNGTGCRVKKGGLVIRILSPLDGEIVETGGLARGWLFRLKPLENGFNTKHLLRGAEIRPWITREAERLQMALSDARLGPSLADGGVPVADFSAANPGADWDALYGDIFLQP